MTLLQTPSSLQPEMSLSPEELAEMTMSLARMGLIDEGESPDLTPLDGGISSLIVRAKTSRGDLCIKRALPQLKVAAEWTVPIERNTAEVGWMRIAAQVSPGSVPAILGEDAEGQAFAMGWLDPTQYPVWKSQLLDGVARVETALAVAEILSRVHNACAHRPDVAQRFANDGVFHAIRLDPYFGTTALAHPDCAEPLRTLIERTGTTRHTLVHGDVSPKNILVGRSGPLLLDAECAWYGDPAFDLAFCLTHLCLKCVWRPEKTAAYLACFDVFASSSLARCGWEPATDIEARTSALLAGMLLARIDGKSPVEYIRKDRDKDRVRQLARNFLLNPGSRLQAMRDVWSEVWTP